MLAYMYHMFEESSSETIMEIICAYGTLCRTILLRVDIGNTNVKAKRLLESDNW